MTPVDAQSWALPVRAGRGEGSPPVTGEGLLERLVRQPGVGDGRLTQQGIGGGVPIAFSRVPICRSTQETKNDATEWISGMSCPLEAACARPVR